MFSPVIAMWIGIIVMMVLIIFTKVHPFPSLIISAILIAVLAMPFGDVSSLTACISTVTTGFGNTMASIGVVIGFGCIMGIFLEKSGADHPQAGRCEKLRCCAGSDRLGRFHPGFLRLRFRHSVLASQGILPSDQKIHGRSGRHPRHGPVYHSLHGSADARPAGCGQHLPGKRTDD